VWNDPTAFRRRRRWSRPGSRISPLFLGFVALTAFGGWLSFDDQRSGARFGVFCFVVGGWVVSLCLHEFGHAYAAYRAGDRSVEAAGYLTLNPLKYAHPFLSIVLPIIFIAQGGIGLPGGAVYLHKEHFRSRAMQSLAAAAGPASNVVFGVVLLVVARGHGDGQHLHFWSGVAFLGFLQLSAAVLNLLPIPGLDGYAIIEPYLDPQTARGFEPVKPWGMLGVFVLLQFHQLNTWFFDLVERLYDATGAPKALWALGYDLFRFWRQSPLGY
jgi:Zn-dependent protease